MDLADVPELKCTNGVFDLELLDSLTQLSVL